MSAEMKIILSPFAYEQKLREFGCKTIEELTIKIREYFDLKEDDILVIAVK